MHQSKRHGGPRGTIPWTIATFYIVSSASKDKNGNHSKHLHHVLRTLISSESSGGAQSQLCKDHESNKYALISFLPFRFFAFVSSAAVVVAIDILVRTLAIDTKFD